MTLIGARQLLDAVVDEGTFESWDTPAAPPPPAFASPDYARALASAQAVTGLDESVLSGCGCIRGRRVAIIVSDFDFMAGSMGVAASERLTQAVERATAERLPLLASPTSGGTRMQEGTVAFLQMVKMTQALVQHKNAGLPYLVYLRHPTMGGVMASFGSLGHITVAQPGAMLGFLGARVYQTLYGTEFPPGVQVAENLYARGIIDAILPPEALAEAVERALRVLTGPGADLPAVDEPEWFVPPARPAWESIEISRRPDRPGVRTFLRLAAQDVVALNGTGQGEADPATLLALARFGEVACIVSGQCRRGQTFAAPVGPAGIREARRGIRMARELNLPLVSIIDTPGAALSADAENGGIAGEIARSIADMVDLHAPTVSVLLGQGTGGGALALYPADRVLAAQHSWLAPLPPEGASAIVHRTTDEAPGMAETQHVRSLDLLRHGIVDRVVPECPDAADEPLEFCARLSTALQYELTELSHLDTGERLRRRRTRLRQLGQA